MTDTTIYIGNIAIHEPTTTFTDYLISLLCFVFFYNLKNNKSVASINNWKNFFLFFGVSTIVGGCAHAFFEFHAGLGYKTLWLAMQVLSGFAVYFAQMATFNSVLQNSKNKNNWRLTYAIQLCVFIAAVFIFQNFLVVVLDNAIGLIPVMVLHFTDPKKIKASKFIAYGILISFLTAFVHVAKLSWNANFNSNDISHILLMVSLSVVFVGVWKKMQGGSNL